MRRIVSAMALALLTAEAASAQNAPFCVVSSGGRQCHYYDAPTCQQRAVDVRGACVVNNSSGVQSPQQDTWGAFQRGARIGESMGSREPPASPQAGSNLGPVIDQFCRDLQRQDIAELETMPLQTDAEIQEYSRKLDIYWGRSERCFAMARAAR